MSMVRGAAHGVASPGKGWPSMRDRGRGSGSPLWADGDMTLRIEATDREA
jgi:hypothetical protein